MTGFKVDATCRTGGRDQAFQLEHKVFPANHLMELHDHEHACLCLVLAGFMHEETSREHMCVAGDVVFKPGRTAHRNHFGCRGARVLSITFRSGVEVLERLALNPGREFSAHAPGATIVASRLVAEAASDRPFTALMSEALLLQCLVTTARGRARQDACPAWLVKTRARIDEAPAAPLRVSMLAAAAGVHPVYLTQQFRRYYGVTPREHAHWRRVELARDLLEHTSLPLTEIATRVGFADQSHFSRVFNRVAGVAPGAYRRHHGGANAPHARGNPSR